MKINKFDVVELTNGYKASNLDIKSGEYYAEIVNPNNGTTIEHRLIKDDEIKAIIFTKNK